MSLNARVQEVKAKLRANLLFSFFTLALGITLGALFFYAGLQKHWAPASFAEAVMAYQLLPQSWVGYVAAVVPWVELTSGFFLVLGYVFEIIGRLAAGLGFASGAMLIGGLKRRSCLLLIMALVSLFLLVLGITLARGLNIDCGCGLFTSRQVGAAAVMENLLILAGAAALYWWEYPGQKLPPPRLSCLLGQGS